MSALSEAIERAKSGVPYGGPRVVSGEDLVGVSDEVISKLETILECMEWPQLMVFRYGDSDRLVAPFVVGVSSEGNALFRGYQLEGHSLSGKGPGWRVFQVEKMENIQNQGDYFDAGDFMFVEYYPWLYKVIRML